MFGPAMYLLSHVGSQADEKKQVVRWFGLVSYNKFSIKELEGWEQSVIRQNVEAVTGYDLNDEDSSIDERKCEEEDCDGRLVWVWNVGLSHRLELMRVDWARPGAATGDGV